MKYLKLHDKDDNSVVIINSEFIISICKTNGTTVIYLKEGDYNYSFEVTESPEKIWEMLEGKSNTAKTVCS